MTFASRLDAGIKLGHHLRTAGIEVDVVVGLPRGGAIVAAEVAHILQRPLELLVVRKIGHPFHREFAVGALAESGVLVLDDAVIDRDPRVRMQLDRVVAEETRRLKAYEARFHSSARPELMGKVVLLVDDGLATGATTEAAVLSARKRGACRILVAAPVASINAMERIERLVDRVIALVVDPELESVGRHYAEFPQASDDEVLELFKSQHAGSS